MEDAYPGDKLCGPMGDIRDVVLRCHWPVYVIYDFSSFTWLPGSLDKLMDGG